MAVVELAVELVVVVIDAPDLQPEMRVDVVVIVLQALPADLVAGRKQQCAVGRDDLLELEAAIVDSVAEIVDVPDVGVVPLAAAD